MCAKRLNLDELNKKAKELGDKADDLKIAVQLKGIDAHDDVKQQLSDAQSAFAAGKEQARIDTDEAKGHAYAQLLGAQMNLRQKKDELTAEIADRKAENDEARARHQLDNAADYAAYAVEAALSAIDEARWAVLNANDLALDYEEKYGSLDD